MSNEQKYYDTLKRIAKSYERADRLLKNGERMYGCSGEEALMMAYENIQQEAANAIKGKRRPEG
jgi:hypothetical protein